MTKVFCSTSPTCILIEANVAGKGRDTCSELTRANHLAMEIVKMELCNGKNWCPHGDSPPTPPLPAGRSENDLTRKQAVVPVVRP